MRTVRSLFGHSDRGVSTPYIQALAPRLLQQLHAAAPPASQPELQLQIEQLAALEQLVTVCDPAQREFSRWRGGGGVSQTSVRTGQRLARAGISSRVDCPAQIRKLFREQLECDRRHGVALWKTSGTCHRNAALYQVNVETGVFFVPGPTP